MGRFCLFSFIFQLPFYTLVFSEWGCFFLLGEVGQGVIQRTFFPCQRKSLLHYSLSLFILLNSEKNEQRSAAAVIGPFGLSLRSPSGGCGIRSAQTVLALFPPSSLRLCRPIKAELTGPFSGFIQLSFFNPSVTTCHLPYILLCKTQGRR